MLSRDELRSEFGSEIADEIIKKQRKKDLLDTVRVLMFCAPVIALCAGGAIREYVKEHKENPVREELTEEVYGDVKEGEIKVFEPGEHYLSLRVPANIAGYENDDIPGLAINNVPAGYEVYQIVPYNQKVASGSATGGYDIWFTNIERVEATASYSEDYELVGYYTFGKVVENNKTLNK